MGELALHTLTAAIVCATSLWQAGMSVWDAFDAPVGPVCTVCTKVACPCDRPTARPDATHSGCIPLCLCPKCP